MSSPDANPKHAVGALKPGLHAIPPVALLLLGQVMQHGAAKYGLMNWRKTRISASTYYDAMQRHLLAWWDGQDNDPDSGLPHLAHVMASCALALDAEQCETLDDDRPVPGQAAALIAELVQKIIEALAVSKTP